MEGVGEGFLEFAEKYRPNYSTKFQNLCPLTKDVVDTFLYILYHIELLPCPLPNMDEKQCITLDFAWDCPNFTVDSSQYSKLEETLETFLIEHKDYKFPSNTKVAISPPNPKNAKKRSVLIFWSIFRRST